jgi:hypothetical protein
LVFLHQIRAACRGWLVKDATQLRTFKKECNKLDLTAARYFCLVDHNDWSRSFAVSSPQVYAVPVTVLLVGLPKKKTYLSLAMCCQNCSPSSSGLKEAIAKLAWWLNRGKYASYPA